MARMALLAVIFIYFCAGVFATDGRSDRSNRSIDEHPAWRLLGEECGHSFSDRIIGGVEASLGQFPWIARLGYEVIGRNYTGHSGEVVYKCTAALLNPWYLLTAAHCVTSLPNLKLVTIRLGEYDEATDPDCRAGVCALPVQDRGIAATAHHPSYINTTYFNDIAIIELQEPVNITETVSPVCLPRGQHLGSVCVGEMLTIAGWGVTNSTTKATASVLQTVQIPVQPSSSCTNDTSSDIAITQAQICAGALNKDSCNDDSGAPLMKVYDSESGPRTHVLGVVSTGPSPCGSGEPGVYTSVSHYMLWILDHIQH